MFSRLEDAGLKLKPTKCHFCRQSVSYLGHVVSADGVSPDPAKVSAVQRFPVPSDATELKNFLGLAGYYRRFIQGFSQLASPLFALLTKGHAYKWTDPCSHAFHVLKDRLTSIPVLSYPRFDRAFHLAVDACDTGLGAVLFQNYDGREHTIAYASRSLNRAERKLLITTLLRRRKHSH